MILEITFVNLTPMKTLHVDWYTIFSSTQASLRFLKEYNFLVAQPKHLFMSLVCYLEYKWEITDIICLFSLGYMEHIIGPVKKK